MHRYIEHLIIFLITIFVTDGVLAVKTKIIEQRTNDITFHPMSNSLYATVPGSDGPPFGNSLIEIDVQNAQIVRHLAVGSDPGVIVSSPNEPYLYIGLEGAGRIVQVNALTLDIKRVIEIDPGLFGPVFAESIAVISDEIETFSVSLQSPETNPRFERIDLFRQGIKMPGSFSGSSISNKIVHLSSSPKLFGFDSETTGGAISEFDITDTGINFIRSQFGISNFTVEAEILGNLIALNSGRVVRVPEMVLEGTFPLEADVGPVTVDIQSGKFLYGTEVFDSDIGSFRIAIDSYDPVSFLRTDRYFSDSILAGFFFETIKAKSGFIAGRISSSPVVEPFRIAIFDFDLIFEDGFEL